MVITIVTTITMYMQVLRNSGGIISNNLLVERD
jgi:hypothetical protein